MLIGLVFRGVAFQFRFKAKENSRHLWDKAFIGGSVTASQAFALVGTLFILPIILMYTVWSYRCFAARSRPTRGTTDGHGIRRMQRGAGRAAQAAPAAAAGLDAGPVGGRGGRALSDRKPDPGDRARGAMRQARCSEAGGEADRPY